MLKENFPPKNILSFEHCPNYPLPPAQDLGDFFTFKKVSKSKRVKIDFWQGGPPIWAVPKKSVFFSGKKRKNNVDLCQSSSHLYLINIFFASKRQTQFMEATLKVCELGKGSYSPSPPLDSRTLPPTGQCVTHDLHPHYHLSLPVSTSDVGCSAKFARTRRF